MGYDDASPSGNLPDRAIVVEYGNTYPDPGGIDPAGAIRKALANAHGFPPLKGFDGLDKKIAFAFPARVKGRAHATDHRRRSIRLTVEELLQSVMISLIKINGG